MEMHHREHHRTWGRAACRSQSHLGENNGLFGSSHRAKCTPCASVSSALTSYTTLPWLKVVCRINAILDCSHKQETFTDYWQLNRTSVRKSKWTEKNKEPAVWIKEKSLLCRVVERIWLDWATDPFRYEQMWEWGEGGGGVHHSRDSGERLFNVGVKLDYSSESIRKRGEWVFSFPLLFHPAMRTWARQLQSWCTQQLSHYCNVPHLTSRYYNATSLLLSKSSEAADHFKNNIVVVRLWFSTFMSFVSQA